MYKIIYKPYAFLLLLLATITACHEGKPEKELIRDACNKYINAVSGNLGTESVKYIDSNTVNYYAQMIPLILKADSSTVARLRMDQRMLVLVIRQTMPVEKIKKLNGASLFEYLVQIGMCESGKGLDKYYFDIHVDKKNHGYIQLVDSNNVRGVVLQFNKEYDQWKIDIPAITALITNSMWRNLVEESGKTEKEFVEQVVELSTNMPLADSTWHALEP
jgi:predicted unusual protein kinase regulating ubiquinone biosynthesis (AarF/ABC1/UbiB family)